MKIKIVEDKGQNPNKINASVQNIGQISLTTDSGKLPVYKLPVYYVIVGCGTAAMVNHTTLRQTEWGKKQIDDLPLMHIGFKDPWTQYFEHGMGQPPYLLGMPGYHQRPVQMTDVFTHNPGCSSKKFAACTQNEWDLLWKKYHTEDPETSKFHYKEGWVAVIQKKDGPMSAKVKEVIEKLKKNEDIDLTEAKINEKLEEPFPSDAPHYRLVVLVPESEEECRLEFVYAKKIDICTGAGRSAVRFDEKKFDNENAVKIGKTRLCVPPRLWSEKTKKRRVINGPEALMTATTWNKTDRVCVFGSGGIGLNMVERGEGEKCHIDWMARTLAASFNLPRNDTVLRHRTKHFNTVKKEELEDYLKEKISNAKDLGKVVSWLLKEIQTEGGESKRRKFENREELKKQILSMSESLRRHESLDGSVGGSEGYGSDYQLVADLVDAQDLLDPARNLSTLGRRMEPGESGVREGAFSAPTNENFVLTPSDEKWRFGKGCELDIAKIEDDKVTVKIKPSTRGEEAGIPEIRDYFEKNTAHTNEGAFILSDDYHYKWINIAQPNENAGGIYDRVCVTTGLVQDEPGEPTLTAAHFEFAALTVDGRTVGLQSDGGNIRILGAAAQVHPKRIFVLDAKQTNDPTSVYFNSLPLSAVPPGFIFTGINIAFANNYFSGYITANQNVNTMTIDELKKWILEEHWGSKETDGTDELLAEKVASAVVKHRRFKDGYENAAAIKKALQTEPSLTNAGEWEAIADILETNYSPARDFID
ncbi:MAG: hypothetical protein LH472_09435 [Pyrinomonadaceae bacterium]|nr:hypothetical protein [Pyrinomonadaceae bacterium]